jgi:DNA transposition AAA+ family ATPase
MPQNTNAVKNVAHLSNVALSAVAMETLINAASHLHRLGVFSGRIGLGKSFAAAYLMNRYNAYRIECKSVWNRQTVLKKILEAMGIKPDGTATDMLDLVCAQLQTSGRPLIIDEMDHLVAKKAVEVVRDIHDGGQAAILMIGEECLPKKLERWGQVHSRVLSWKTAQPLDIDDATTLIKFYSTSIIIEEDLIAFLHRQAEGSARRLVTNLALVEEVGLRMGLVSISLDVWMNGGQPLYTGKSPNPGGSK